MEGHPELVPLMALGMEMVRQKEMGRTVGCIGSRPRAVPLTSSLHSCFLVLRKQRAELGAHTHSRRVCCHTGRHT